MPGMGGEPTLRFGRPNVNMGAMKKWWLVGLIVILFVGGLAWKVIDAKDCADRGNIIVASLTAHQDCVRR